MYKIGLSGNFGKGNNDYNGQTVKTRTICREIANLIGNDKIKIVDTHNWRKRIFSLFLNCFNLTRTCENIVILPGSNGIKVFTTLFLLFNRLFHRKIHYIVIGGWLPELLARNVRLKNKVSRFDGIYVEANSMVETLNNLGLNNVRYLSNTKRLNILEERELIYPTEEPYKLCTFSRVTKEKGIEDAIEAVTIVNNYFERVVYTLDIYGQVDEKYKARFLDIEKMFPKYITYKGVVNSDDSVEVLKSYCALLFPTYYEGEGFAGTILDAYASGIPIIATNWKYNAEIILDHSDGFIYDYKNMFELTLILKDIVREPQQIVSMKINCLNRAKQYMPEVVVGSFIKLLIL